MQQTTSSDASSPTAHPITRRVMQDNEYLEFSDVHAPNAVHIILMETMIYGLMGKLCPDYTGGCWDFIALSNDAWFMEFKDQKKVQLLPANGGPVEMSSEAAGVALMLYLLNHMEWDFHFRRRSAQMASAHRSYNALWAYAKQLPDIAAIKWVLD